MPRTQRTESLIDLPDGTMPVMPLRNAVLFPMQVIPLSVGRERSLALLRDCVQSEQRIAIVAQRDSAIEQPSPPDLYSIGCTAGVLKVFDLPDGNKSVVIHGLSRVRLIDYAHEEPYLVARVEEIESIPAKGVPVAALTTNLRNLIQKLAELATYLTSEHAGTLASIQDPSQFADFAAAALNISVDDRQNVLETFDVAERLERVTMLYNREIEILELGSKIQSKVQGEISKTQREYYLREQLKAIRKELGDVEDEAEEIGELRERISRASMPEEAERVALRELDRLSRIPQASAEYTVARTYLDWLCDLPWTVKTEDTLDLGTARRVLDADHYGLEKIKRRILEHLAVQQLAGNKKAPILCFAGPPGVGKTSLGQSIARAVGRKFVRVSLGGIRDEAEIRGHRRTYIGALPGRVIQGIRKCGTRNPLFMLDEIDKLGTDFRGDPASALLEVLDPEQNSTFSDHYIEVPFDLSQVMFIATANYIEYAPPALRDRLEILDLPGYIEEEKLGVARHFLLPKQLREHGLRSKQLRIPIATLKKIVRGYTREAGVRTLERQLAAVCRGVAVDVVDGKHRGKTRIVGPGDLGRYLGPERFHFESAERIPRPGIATGVAWTPSGGDLLYIEATHMPGKGRLTLTGQLGEVMRESAQAALSYIRANSELLKLDEEFFAQHDLHIHVPAGAVPKDGPSAGVTIFTALFSLLAGKRVRHDTAMTGEITLRGLILPVGGIKEKVLAAQRAGIKRFLLPAKNKPDLEEIPKRVLDKIEFLFVSEIAELAPLLLVADRGHDRSLNGSGARGSKRTRPSRRVAQPRATRASANASGSKGTRSSIDSPTPR
jgi:ATP-dependent Lon protease